MDSGPTTLKLTAPHPALNCESQHIPLKPAPKKRAKHFQSANGNILTLPTHHNMPLQSNPTHFPTAPRARAGMPLLHLSPVRGTMGILRTGRSLD
ncbi:hypothetical protein KC318_g12 [Hortaea werneckii]|nr:hypothetical protein KC334_g12 [Hortaea werneckii]KAI7028348.1 hypothetical protein KC355_g13 [Hortaea werneckii]KAI7676784.1 hypothetical protein KC318_g12 [Hortaea werneckii]